ncbi:MAG TPA: hypothetical protein ENM98_00045 [Halothiobacillaceae bacterium]|nr:hypothetical protein [Halothiobacillaceae bacterium]
MNRQTNSTLPNDFSLIQQAAMAEGLIDRTFWFCPPEHLNYFNPQGLKRLVEACGWQVQDAFSDFPIDWFLLNEHANYVTDRARGAEAHAARERIESLMVQRDPEGTLNIYRELLAMGMGRNITLVVTPMESRR